jgi:uncharacterized phage protein gp47/JayE
MTVIYPGSRRDVIDLILTDMQAELPQLNPSLRNEFCNAFAVAFGGRIYEAYLTIQELQKQSFPDTATGEFLERWGSYVNITRNAATGAQGRIVVSGTPGTNISEGTTFNSVSSTIYTAQNENFDGGITYPVTISTHTMAAYTLTSAFGYATMTFLTPHPFATGQTVTVSGATPAGYNGSFVAFVEDDFNVSYPITGTLTSPATGTITMAANMAVLPVTSAPETTVGNEQSYGVSTNLDSGMQLTVITPIAGMVPIAYVSFDGVSGGADEENNTDLFIRIINRYQHPITPFNEAEIINQAQTVPGVTRVFVEGPDTTVGSYVAASITRVDNIATVTMATAHGLSSGDVVSITGASPTEYNVTNAGVLVNSPTTFLYILSGTPSSPATGTITVAFPAVKPGQVKVLFTLDNDPISIIPDGAVVDLVKDALLAIKPAHMAKKDLIVLAPTPKAIDFNFAYIVPNTTTMQAAVKASLEEFFREGTSLGTPLLAKAYNNVIYSTNDPESGAPLRDYALIAPTGDIQIQVDELPVLGTVTI